MSYKNTEQLYLAKIKQCYGLCLTFFESAHALVGLWLWFCLLFFPIQPSNHLNLVESSQVDSDCSRYFGRTEVRAFRNIACFMHTNKKTFRFIAILKKGKIVLSSLSFSLSFIMSPPIARTHGPIFITIIRFIIINKYCLRSS